MIISLLSFLLIIWLGGGRGPRGEFGGTPGGGFLKGERGVGLEGERGRGEEGTDHPKPDKISQV